MRPRLLDLYCGAGGAAMGYHRAGFDVIGVDKRPQPRYPFEFILGDALEVLGRRQDLDQFAAIHASPPCQAYSATTGIWNNRRDHPDLLRPTREALRATGLPWIIENVPGAPMRVDVQLCGSSFGLAAGEYELRRHRWFELSGWWCMSPPCDHGGPVLGVYGGHARDRRRQVLGVYGNGGGQINPGSSYGNKASRAQARALMGIDWMTVAEISEAIPPAYTEYLGRELLGHLQLTQSLPID